MRRGIQLLIALQIVSWAVAMVFIYLGPDQTRPIQTIESYSFVGAIAFLTCFVPALRMARHYQKQPLALMLAILPMLAALSIVILNTL